MNGFVHDGVLRVKYLFLLGCSIAMAAPAVARADEAVSADAVSDSLITVVGIGLPDRLDNSGQSISVVTSAEIAAIQGPDIVRVLERLPGVAYSRNGGPGGFTGVRVRGAEAEQLLVLVDGVRMDDPSLPSGGTNFGNLLADGIDKVELLRGSNSVVWGSQAIGGVMALTTRQLEGADVSAEYGAYETFTGTAAAGGTFGAASGTLAAGFTRSHGFSEVAGDPEADGYRQWNLTGKGRVDLGGGLALTANGRYADSRRAIDGFGATSNDVQFTKDASARAGLVYTGEALDLAASGAVYDIRRHYEGTDLGGLFFRGRTYQAELSGRWRVTPAFSLVFGGGNDWSRFHDAATSQKTASQTSAHALLDYRSGGLSLAGGLRYDHHDQFGGQWTAGANGSFEFVSGWRVRASYGEGFKAPTLYQLFSFGDDYGFVFSGNPGLKPEHSRSYDVGLEHGDRNGPLHFAATLFRRDSRDLISFVGCDGTTVGICAAHAGDFMFGTYANIGKARAEGFELEADLRLNDTLSLHAVYTYVKSYNRVTGTDLARRPRNTLNLAADWVSPLNGLTFGGDIRLVSDSFNNAANTVRLDGYYVAGARVSYPVSHNLEIYGRIENVTDVNYQTVTGYNTPGRSAYIGARVKL